MWHVLLLSTPFHSLAYLFEFEKKNTKLGGSIDLKIYMKSWAINTRPLKWLESKGKTEECGR